MGGGLKSRCVGRVYGADGAVHGILRGCIQNTEKCEYRRTSNREKIFQLKMV
jgi:hypothetical protein